EVASAHELRHVIDEAQHEHRCRPFKLQNAPAKLLVAPAHGDQLPRVRVFAQLANLRRKVANAGGAAHDEHGESMLIEAKAAPQGLFLSGSGRAKTEVDRQPEELDAVGGHAAAQRNL